MQAAEGAFDLAWVSHEWADGSDGLKIARHLRLVDPTAALRVLLVAEAGECRARALEEAGADDLVLRPVDRCEALARSRVALEKSRLRSAFRETLPSAMLPLASRLSQPVRRRPPDRFAA
jgi:DNA-binding response OmpR family regulator